MKKTFLIYHKDYLLHDIPFHPERKERLITSLNYLKEKGILERLDIITPELAREEDILRTHSKKLYERILEISKRGRGAIDPDTLLNAHTFRVALLAAGGVIKAADLIMRKKYKNCLALIRPPGHHATKNQAMGFCYFNNVALAADYLREVYNLKKICIMDWDAHAGNGTMEIFYKTKDVLNISIHQDPSYFYPGVGFIHQKGEEEGEGYTINIPLEEGACNSDYLFLLEEFVIPKIREFHPEFIIISSGCDSHKDDSISSLCLNEEGYGMMTNLFISLSEDLCEGRLLIALEGGYNLEALAKSNYEIVKTLLGESEYSFERKENILNSTYQTLEKLKSIFS